MLQEWGLIKEVGRTSESDGIPERVFDLTDAGREFVDELQTTAEQVEDTLVEFQATDENLNSRIDDLHERFDELIDRLERELL